MNAPLTHKQYQRLIAPRTNVIWHHNCCPCSTIFICAISKMSIWRRQSHIWANHRIMTKSVNSWHVRPCH